MHRYATKLFELSKYPHFARTARQLLTAYIICRTKNIERGSHTKFIGNPIIERSPGSRISIGMHCVLCSDSRHTSLGINHPVILRTMCPGAKITIGDGTGISGGSICAVESISIGRMCLLGANVSIMDNDFHLVSTNSDRNDFAPGDLPSKAIEIGNYVFIGTGSIILKGTTIGANAVIGAGSVVRGIVEPNSIYAGNPAKRIK